MPPTPPPAGGCCTGCQHGAGDCHSDRWTDYCTTRQADGACPQGFSTCGAPPSPHPGAAADTTRGLLIGAVALCVLVLAIVRFRRRRDTVGGSKGGGGSSVLAAPLLGSTHSADLPAPTGAGLQGETLAASANDSTRTSAALLDGTVVHAAAAAAAAADAQPSASRAAAAAAPVAAAATTNGPAAAAVTTTFTAADLSRFTSKFAHPLGSGAFGTVYRGTLPSGRPIAVKQMELAVAQKKKKLPGNRSNPYTGEKGFQLELEVLRAYVHPNLVELIGYCVTTKRKVTTGSLVLEFMPLGSLLEQLAAALTPLAVSQQRLDIAADVARALHYLHAEAKPPLIHQDVKTDNILLTEFNGRLVAKVADFGTARIVPQLAMSSTVRAKGGGQTHHSTGIIVGTRPYMAAEYAQLGQVSEKTDTFAYGVVLLELLTGKPPYDDDSGEVLHQYAYDMLCDPPGRLAPLLDRRVPAASWVHTNAATGQLAGRALELCLVAKRCLEHARARCTMREAMPTVSALAEAT